MSWRRRAISALLLAGVFQASAQPVLRFDPKMYPSESFRISRRDYALGPVTVRIIQVKRLEDANGPPHISCRAWLEVRTDRLLKQLYYDNIESLGFSYGIFVPKRQPLADYFVAVKEGDYDGRLLLVGRDGHMSNLPGGFYFLTPDNRFLVGDHVTDTASLIVIDVTRHQVVIDGEKDRGIPMVYQWYLDGSGYFFTEQDGERGVELKGRVYRVDLEHYRVAKTAGTRLANARKVDYDFDPRKMTDCISTPQ